MPTEVTPAETKTVTAFTVTGVRRNSDGNKVLLVETTYDDATTEEHVVPVVHSEPV